MVSLLQRALRSPPVTQWCVPAPALRVRVSGHHSVSRGRGTRRTTPAGALKPGSNSVEDLRFRTSPVLPFLNKRLNILGVIDFASFRFSKIALKPSTERGAHNRQ